MMLHYNYMSLRVLRSAHSELVEESALVTLEHPLQGLVTFPNPCTISMSLRVLPLKDVAISTPW